MPVVCLYMDVLTGFVLIINISADVFDPVSPTRTYPSMKYPF